MFKNVGTSIKICAIAFPFLVAGAFLSLGLFSFCCIMAILLLFMLIIYSFGEAISNLEFQTQQNATIINQLNTIISQNNMAGNFSERSASQSASFSQQAYNQQALNQQQKFYQQRPTQPPQQ